MRAKRVKVIRQQVTELYSQALIPADHLKRAYRRLKQSVRNGQRRTIDEVLSFLRPPRRAKTVEQQRARHRLGGREKRRTRAQLKLTRLRPHRGKD